MRSKIHRKCDALWRKFCTTKSQFRENLIYGPRESALLLNIFYSEILFLLRSEFQAELLILEVGCPAEFHPIPSQIVTKILKIPWEFRPAEARICAQVPPQNYSVEIILARLHLNLKTA